MNIKEQLAVHPTIVTATPPDHATHPGMSMPHHQARYSMPHDHLCALPFAAFALQVRFMKLVWVVQSRLQVQWLCDTVDMLLEAGSGHITLDLQVYVTREKVRPNEGELVLAEYWRSWYHWSWYRLSWYHCWYRWSWHCLCVGGVGGGVVRRVSDQVGGRNPERGPRYML